MRHIIFNSTFLPQLCVIIISKKERNDRSKNNKVIHIILWIAQALLTIMFLMAGIMKTSQPIEALVESIPWVTSTY